MATSGEWIQGPRVMIDVTGPESIFRWDRDPASTIPLATALDGSWGESYDVFPAVRSFRGTYIAMFNGAVARYVPAVSRVAAVETFPTVDPGDWPDGAVDIEYEDTGGSYVGLYEVSTQYMIDAAQSSPVSTQASRLLQAPSGWPASPVASNFPSATDFAGWVSRHAGSVVVSTPPLGVTTVSWSQSDSAVALMALAQWMWDAGDTSQRPTLQYHVTRPKISRSYTPPRHRFIFADPVSGMWTQRQRHTAGGNSGGLPARQRHNRRFNGSWPERQRHKDI